MSLHGGRIGKREIEGGGKKGECGRQCKDEENTADWYQLVTMEENWQQIWGISLKNAIDKVNFDLALKEAVVMKHCG